MASNQACVVREKLWGETLVKFVSTLASTFLVCDATRRRTPVPRGNPRLWLPSAQLTGALVGKGELFISGPCWTLGAFHPHSQRETASCFCALFRGPFGVGGALVELPRTLALTCLRGAQMQDLIQWGLCTLGHTMAFSTYNDKDNGCQSCLCCLGEAFRCGRACRLSFTKRIAPLGEGYFLPFHKRTDGG